MYYKTRICALSWLITKIETTGFYCGEDSGC